MSLASLGQKFEIQKLFAKKNTEAKVSNFTFLELYILGRPIQISSNDVIAKKSYKGYLVIFRDLLQSVFTKFGLHSKIQFENSTGFSRRVTGKTGEISFAHFTLNG